MNEIEFRAFFVRMHPKMLRYAMRNLDAETAGEVASDVMRTLWTKKVRAPSDADEDRQLQSLCYRICDGAIRNAQRSARRERRLLAAACQEVNSLRGRAAILDEVMEEPAILALVASRDRELLLLLADGYRVQEIAVILNTSPAAISMRLKRARMKLAASGQAAAM